MKSTDIKDVRYNGNEVSALYKGSTLISSRKPKVPSNVLAGSFSEPDDIGYKIMINTTKPFYIHPEDDGSFYCVPNFQPFTSCYQMFYNQDKLTSITAFPDTSNVTNMGGMFYKCPSLTLLHLSSFDTAKVTNMSNMFANCTSLTTLDLGNFNTDKVDNISGIFSNCTSLTNVTGTVTLKKNVTLSSAPLTNDSAMVFINGLADVSSTMTITFSKTTYNTLTEEQIALATSKGWSVGKF